MLLIKLEGQKNREYQWETIYDCRYKDTTYKAMISVYCFFIRYEQICDINSSVFGLLAFLTTLIFSKKH